MFKPSVAKKIANLTEKSKGIVDIFTQTINDLHDVNDEARIHYYQHQDKIDQLKAQQIELDVIQQNNQKVIDKISKIFE